MSYFTLATQVWWNSVKYLSWDVNSKISDLTLNLTFDPVTSLLKYNQLIAMSYFNFDSSLMKFDPSNKFQELSYVKSKISGFDLWPFSNVTQNLIS